MITALIILSIALGLKKLGVDLPFIDKTIDFMNAKADKLKAKVYTSNHNLENPTKIKAKTNLNTKIHDKNLTFKANTYPRTNLYSGSLKI